MASWQADRVSGVVQAGETLVMEWPALGAEVSLEVVRAQPPERLLLRSGDSSVDLRLEPGAVTLTHAGLGPEDDLEGFAASWRVTLALLAHAVERHGARPRQTEWWLRPVRTSPESAYVLFTTGPGLRTWLTTEGEVGPNGSEYRLDLSPDLSLTGKVLANVASRDVALSCDNFSAGALQLRTLPSPRAEDERLVALVWSRWDGSERVEPRISNALTRGFDRLCAALAQGGQG